MNDVAPIRGIFKISNIIKTTITELTQLHSFPKTNSLVFLPFRSKVGRPICDSYDGHLLAIIYNY